jgi:hypothetical protein
MSQSFYPPARPLTIAETLDLAVQIFKATVVKCLPYGICAVVAQELPNLYEVGSSTVRQPFGGGRPMWIVLFVVGTLLALIAWSALLLRQRAIIEHTPTTIGAELVQTLRRLPSFVLATLFVLVAAGGEFAALLLVSRQYHTEALIALIALSSFVAILLSCTWPAVLLAGHGPLGGVRQSIRLVWGNWWRTAAIYTVGAVLVLVLGLLVGILIALVVPTLTSDVPVMWATFSVIANAMMAVVAPLVGALLLAVFGELRARTEGVDLERRIAGLAVE